MAAEFLWVAANREEAIAQALLGREHVCREWNRQKAFSDLREIIETVRDESMHERARTSYAI
jgi:hypothetical protein